VERQIENDGSRTRSALSPSTQDHILFLNVKCLVTTAMPAVSGSRSGSMRGVRQAQSDIIGQGSLIACAWGCEAQRAVVLSWQARVHI
jgi:hypothetical protein